MMEKAQDIPLDVIFNTLHNVKVKDADHEFEDIEAPLPGSSSYVPIPNYQDKTMKKGVPAKEEIEE